MKYKIILASNSPRRRELLAGLDVNFEVKVLNGIDESYPDDLDAYQVAEFIAQKKAEAYRSLLDNEESSLVENLVLTADTVVVAPAADEQNDQEGKGIILGKPKTADDAVRMLKMLSGKLIMWLRVYVSPPKTNSVISLLRQRFLSRNSQIGKSIITSLIIDLSIRRGPMVSRNGSVTSVARASTEVTSM